MPNESQSSPDTGSSTPVTNSSEGLTLKGAEDDDFKFVTEKLGKMNPWIHRILCVWLVVLSIGSVIMLIRVWPTMPTVAALRNKADSLSQRFTLISKSLENASPDTALHTIKDIVAKTTATSNFGTGSDLSQSERSYFLLAILSGILGGCLHGLSSLMDFRGQRRLFRSWTMWYFGLPIVGGMVSLIFFLVLGAGLFPNASTLDVASPYGIAAIGALSGLFTDKATLKLSEVLDTLFSTSSKGREGKLNS